jgi:hypothetical protein
MNTMLKHMVYNELLFYVFCVGNLYGVYRMKFSNTLSLTLHYIFLEHLVCWFVLVL